MAEMKQFLREQMDVLKGVNAPPEDDPLQISTERMAIYVGVVALILPTVLYFSRKLAWVCDYQSISHFFYAPVFGAFFVGALGFIAVFLFIFSGNKKADYWMSGFGGAFAIGVALFPTEGAGCAYANGEFARVVAQYGGTDGQALPVFLGFAFLGEGFDHHIIGTIHIVSAVLLFSVLIWFSLVSFRRNNGSGVMEIKGKGRKVGYVKTSTKLRRNFVYWFCGLGMIACLAYIGWLWATTDASETANIFVPEALALYFFAISWLVKAKIIPGFAD